MIQLLLEGDGGGYQGAIFRLAPGARLRFPIPRRALPLLLGGWGERMGRLAGKMADMFKVGGCANPESAPRFRSYLERGATEAGRDPSAVQLVYGAVTVVDRDPRIAEAIARRNVAPYVAVAGRLDPTCTPPNEEMRALEQGLASGDEEGASIALSLETLRRFAVFGTPRDLIARFEELFAAGVDRFELGTPHGVDEAEAIRMLGEEVLPHFER